MRLTVSRAAFAAGLLVALLAGANATRVADIPAGIGAKEDPTDVLGSAAAISVTGEQALGFLREQEKAAAASAAHWRHRLAKYGEQSAALDPVTAEMMETWIAGDERDAKGFRDLAERWEGILADLSAIVAVSVAQWKR